MSYGLAIGDSGEVYTIGAYRTRRVPSAAEVQARKKQKADAQKKRMQARYAKKKQVEKKQVVARKKKEAPKIAANKKKSAANFTLLGLHDKAIARESSYRNLNGFIGDGLIGFEQNSESVISTFGNEADFGDLPSLQKQTKKMPRIPHCVVKKRYRHPDFAGSSLGEAKDQNSLSLVFNINKAIDAKLAYDKLEKETWAKVRKLPAGAAKTALIAKMTKDGQDYIKNTLVKLWRAIDLLEMIQPDKAAQLRSKVEAGQPVTVTMGLAPIVLGVIAGSAAVGIIAALGAYMSGAKASTVQMKANSDQIDKLMAVMSDVKATPEAKAAAAKGIANLTAANKEMATDTSSLGNIAKISSAIVPIMGVGIVGFLVWRFGLLNKVTNIVKPKLLALRSKKNGRK